MLSPFSLFPIAHLPQIQSLFPTATLPLAILSHPPLPPLSFTSHSAPLPVPTHRILRLTRLAFSHFRTPPPPFRNTMSTNTSPYSDLPVQPPLRWNATQRFSRNPFRRRRRHQSPAIPDSSNDFVNQPKPIYIYPGLLRIVRDKAIALDNQCPAVHYKCRECRKDATQPQGPPCSHHAACSICLDDFHSKDLVRRLPCNANHVFHSKCILDWFISNSRCPLCNEPVTNNTSRPPFLRDDHRVSPSHLPPQRYSDDQNLDMRRTRSYRAAPTITMDRSREARLPPQERRISDVRERPPHHSDLTDLPPMEPSCQDDPDLSPKPNQQGEKPRKKGRGPRRYSYIVHDKVRMELNPVIPV